MQILSETQDQVATKTDLELLETRLRGDLTVKIIGGNLATILGTVALLKYLN